MKFQKAYATEIFVSDESYIILRQDDYLEGDAVVALTADQGKKLLLALPSLIDEAESENVE